jgi:hypothetical protein
VLYADRHGNVVCEAMRRQSQVTEVLEYALAVSVVVAGKINVLIG